MCAAVAGLIIFSKVRTASPQSGASTGTADTVPPANSGRPDGPPTTHVTPTVVTPAPTTQVVRTEIVPRPATVVPETNSTPETPETKPLPVLEREYAATTNRDERLDLMMDVADSPGPEAVRALARLFQLETDPDLKVDLLDSLLGIEGQVDEKLILLSLGSQKGLPKEVRQAAVDGLIDLDDQRVIPILNGLLNDPDEDIRESAKDALEMVQAQPAVKLK